MKDGQGSQGMADELDRTRTLRSGEEDVGQERSGFLGLVDLGRREGGVIRVGCSGGEGS